MTAIGHQITALIVTHDSAHVLPNCLSALATAQIPVVIVDNASSDNTLDIGEARGATCLPNARNEGFGRAMNRGLWAIDSPHVLLMNPDIVLENGAVEQLLKAARAYPNAAILGPQVIEADGAPFFTHWSLLAPYLKNDLRIKCVPEGDCCVPFLLGACWLVRRDIIASIGGFDPNIFLFYEDDDLCRRVIEAGHTIVYVHDAIAHHKRGTSSFARPGRVYKSRLHLAWSKLYVSKKWHIDTGSSWEIINVFLKWLFYKAKGDRDRAERYAGSLAGHRLFKKGARATQIEGLDEGVGESAIEQDRVLG